MPQRPSRQRLSSNADVAGMDSRRESPSKRALDCWLQLTLPAASFGKVRQPLGTENPGLGHTDSQVGIWARPIIFAGSLALQVCTW
jgi:hypothetical protein